MIARHQPQPATPPFCALPAYLGGKRRLSPVIFSLLAETIPVERWRTLTFVDPFLGGGSVSLYAKAQGFRVVCNDIALRSAAVGHALIANSRVRLQACDVAALLATPPRQVEHRATERYSPSVFSRRQAALLDRALANLPVFQEPKRSLLMLLIIKWALRVQPMSMLRGTDARAAFEGDLDRVSPRRLGHYLRSEQLLRLGAWSSLAEEVNTGVFPGRGEAFQEDALTFLSHADGDVVYLDSPYPGTTSYEKEYAVLDDLLEGAVRSRSAYSQSSDLLPNLFAACESVPVWLVSLNNTVLSMEELTALVRKFRRNVRSITVRHRHLASIASEKKNAENRELLLLATD